MKRYLPALLAALMLLPAASCGSAEQAETAQTEAAVTTAEAVATEEIDPYDYKDADYKGHKFLFLSQEEVSWANALICPAELTGDLLNDALYNRNKRVEDRYNVTLAEDKRNYNDIISMLKQAVNAGDASYDATVIPLHLAGGVIFDDYVVDLETVKEMNLDEPWWDQAVRASVELNNHLYMITSDISFFAFEATWGVFFNEDMMTDLHLDYPYDLVREGKWTIDKLTEYALAAPALNGDASYDWNSKTGKSRYGFCSHHDFPLALQFGGMGDYTAIEDGKPVYLADSEKMFNIYEKIAKLTSVKGAYYDWNFSDTDSGNIPGNFMNRRFLMCSETLGYLNQFREMEDTFGVLPIPKYDEDQKDYRCIVASWGTTMMGIPASAEDVSRTGVILDVLAYDSYRNLVEPYYDTYLMHKGIRNEDSAEMLQIIRATRSVCTDMAFGWTSNLNTNVKAQLKTGSAEVASIIASEKSSVLGNMEKTLEKCK